jgi:hypothetical protein
VYTGWPAANSTVDPTKLKWRRAIYDGADKLPLKAGCWLKAHLTPLRFMALYTVTDWPDRLKHCCEDYIVIDKPAGVPVQPHASNYIEALPTAASRMFNLGHLSIVHRYYSAIYTYNLASYVL